MEGRTLAFSRGFFCMFGNHLHDCFYRNMIVELTFQVWIPIKNQEATKPSIKSAIFLRCLQKKYYTYMLSCSTMHRSRRVFFPTLMKLKNDGAN